MDPERRRQMAPGRSKSHGLLDHGISHGLGEPQDLVCHADLAVVHGPNRGRSPRNAHSEFLSRGPAHAAGPSPVSSTHASAVAPCWRACNIITKSPERRGHPMRRIKLDKIDRRILRDLQANGRMTNVELARRAGISAPPCLRRVRALEEAGYIRGYHADVNAQALGFGVTVFAQVGLASQAEPDLKAFETLVRTWPQVREVHMLAGEADFLLKIVAEDWDRYQRFLTTQLTAAPNVSHVKSALAIRTSKFEPGVPIETN